MKCAPTRPDRAGGRGAYRQEADAAPACEPCKRGTCRSQPGGPSVCRHGDRRNRNGPGGLGSGPRSQRAHGRMTARSITLSKRTPQRGTPSTSREMLSVPAAPADARCAETQRDPGVPAGWPHRAARLPAWGTLPAPPHLRSRGAFFFLPALAGEASLRPAQPNLAGRGAYTGSSPAFGHSSHPALHGNAQTENAQAEPPVLSRDVRRKAVFSQARRRRRRGHPRQGPPPPHRTRRAKNPILGPILGGTTHRLPRRARNQPYSGWFPVSPRRPFKWLKPEKGHEG